MSFPQSPDEGDETDSPLASPDLETPSPPLSDPTSPRSPFRTVSTSDMTSNSSISHMTPSSTPVGALNAARGKPPVAAASTLAGKGGAGMNPLAARMKNFASSRQGQPAIPSRQNSMTPGGGGVASPGPSTTGFPSGFKLPPQLQRPGAPHVASSPAIPNAGGAKGPAKGMSLAEKRGMKLPGGLPGAPTATAPPGAAPRKKGPGLKLSNAFGDDAQANGDAQPNGDAEKPKEKSQLEAFGLDAKTGTLNFKGKAVLSATGVKFESGREFSISLDEVDTMDELGKGNYGTVYKVRHSRPKFRQVGQGLAGNKPRGATDDSESPLSPVRGGGNTTGIVMAMKEMRLELDDAKFQTIIMELDVLHRCFSPYIVDFYGAFFQEGAVYICMEWMDGGSVDRIYGDGVPENVLRKITLGTVMGLKSLKEEHNIIHRDVKPTNILVNTRGQVKICDFGVSGNLVASIAKTNIGCQSYMAPERISSGGVAASGMSAGTYSVQSDIWSLGLSIIECAMGRYPYPPETYDNIFSQLSAIVDGAPPDLPENTFSLISRDFVAGCLNKIPKLRPTYPMLLQHAWLAPLAKPQTIMEEDEEAAEAEDAVDSLTTGTAGLSVSDAQSNFIDQEVGEWVIEALDRRKRGVMGKAAKPALHAAPLDATGVASPKLDEAGGAAAVAVDA